MLSVYFAKEDVLHVMSDPTEWYPARMLRKRTEDEDQIETPRFALIILNQPLRDVPTLKILWMKGILFGLVYMKIKPENLC